MNQMVTLTMKAETRAPDRGTFQGVLFHQTTQAGEEMVKAKLILSGSARNDNS